MAVTLADLREMPGPPPPKYPRYRSSGRAALGLLTSRYGSVNANRALVRVRVYIARNERPASVEVERMLEFLWRMSSSYTYRPYGYYENYHASRVLYRWLRIYGGYKG
ncbi:MAG: hypothetical protein Tp182DCM212571_19 [Prokaryotic dsDNA virus sp.]|nr:MAG: hypothetical protein Tp182DCM212571_19 [Prokaryotic dsDNA virus sp.]